MNIPIHSFHRARSFFAYAIKCLRKYSFDLSFGVCEGQPKALQGHAHQGSAWFMEGKAYSSKTGRKVNLIPGQGILIVVHQAIMEADPPTGPPPLFPLLCLLGRGFSTRIPAPPRHPPLGLQPQPSSTNNSPSEPLPATTTTR